MPATTVTIITPALNGGDYFRQTLQSVLGQTGDFDLELIVIDGGSTDGTLELLRSTADPRLRWSTEPDGGQTAAINKGLAQAQGDIVAWLNCDDLYAPAALARVVRAFREDKSAHWLVGRCKIIDNAGNPARQKVTDYKNRLLDHFSFRSLLRMNMISQPAVFWRRDFGKAIGKLDESLHWAMDYDLWLRMARQSRPKLIGDVLASFRVHDTSKSRGGRRGQFEEGYQVARRYMGKDWRSRWAHRWNVEKIVWGYRAMRWVGR